MAHLVVDRSAPRNPTTPRDSYVEWPGPANALQTLIDLWAEWSRFVDALDPAALESASLTSFPFHDERPFIYVVGWASMELTKNIAEMSLLRRIQRDLARG